MALTKTATVMAAVSISTVKHTQTCLGRGCARNPERKAVKPVRAVGYANRLT